MYKMTAAHPVLPIPRYAQVTNLKNGRSVIVRVNDRGPFKHNRVMDLSYAAALTLDVVRTGTGQVVITAIGETPVSSVKREYGYCAFACATGHKNIQRSQSIFPTKIKRFTRSISNERHGQGS